jgi:Tol biopolymer transport system component
VDPDGRSAHGNGTVKGLLRSRHGAGRRPLVALLLAALVALAAASSASARPQRPAGPSAAKPRWMVFVAQRPGLSAQQLFRITTAGTGLKQLTKGNFPAEAPAFSPDGKRVAFARLGAGIYSVNVDGSGLRALTKNGRDGFPAWSPDGKQIAFIRPVGSVWRAMVMSASGGGERPLGKAPSSGRPTWTSSGLLIPTNGDLARVDPTTGRVQKLYGALIDASVGMDTTAVAPDHSVVTFIGPRAPDPGDKGCGEGVPCQRYALYIQDLSKHKDPRILVRDAGPATFSSDGKSLAYVLGKRIVFRAVAGGAPKSIAVGTLSPTTSTPPAWQRG